MGQAKNRGSFEERKALAIEKEIEEKRLLNLKPKVKVVASPFVKGLSELDPRFEVIMKSDLPGVVI